MAITPNTFKNLTFGGVNSADYGVYISGEGVYNVPARAVELTQIPGRNGAIPVDLGRWENIEITYPCGMFGSDQTDFAANYSDFINAIASQKGYQRLEDTYHPDEFRQALFVSGVETKPIGFGQAGEFELVFNCKPQRFLTIGEEAVSVTSGEDIDNETLYDAQPLIEVEGYGGITLGDFSIYLDNAMMGPTEVLSNYTLKYRTDKTPVIQSAGVYNAGDILSVSWNAALLLILPPGVITSITVTSNPSNGTASVEKQASRAYINYTPTSVANFDTSLSSSEVSDTFGVKIVRSDSTTWNETVTAKLKFEKVTGGCRLQISITTSSFPNPQNESGGEIVEAVVDSTVNILGHPTYIDCESGDAYKIDSGNYVSLNQFIDLGSILPTLAPGLTTITYDNTITDLDVTPRWWKL